MKILIKILVLFLLFSPFNKLSAQEWLKTKLTKSTQLMLEERSVNNFKKSNTSSDLMYLNPDDSLSYRFSQLRYRNENFYTAFYPSFFISSGIMEEGKFTTNNSLGFNYDIAYNLSGHLFAMHAGTEFFAGVQPYYIRLRMQDRKAIPGMYSGDVINKHWNLAYIPDIYFHYQSPWILSFESGINKNFLGEGMRSLFLSENSSPYPYAKIKASFSNINYQINWMWLNNKLNQRFIENENKKFAVYHFLEWNISDRFSLGFFESVIWTNENRSSYEFQYLNPLIFFRPVEFSIGSSDNALLGINIKSRLFDKTVLYGQFLIDDIKVGELMNDIRHRIDPDGYEGDYGWFGNKYAAQLGIKAFDLFKIDNLFLRGEINAVRPFVYGHSDVSRNYSHNYMSLSHPLGANFVEISGNINYRIQDFSFDFLALTAVSGKSDKVNNMGDNIFYPVIDAPSENYNHAKTYSNEILQGEKSGLLYLRADFAWIVDKNGSLELFTRAFYRSFDRYDSPIKDFGIVIGARTHNSLLREIF